MIQELFIWLSAAASNSEVLPEAGQRSVSLVCFSFNRCSPSPWMRATASLPGCLQRTLGSQALMDLTRSVRYLNQSHFLYKYLLNQAEPKLTELCITASPFVVNLGGLLLQALLEFWPRTRINPMDEEENEVNHGKDPVDSPSTAKPLQRC